MAKEDYTVIITTKNRQEELLFTLDTLCCIFDDNQIIICDDGGSNDIAKTLNNKYPDVRVLKNEINRGLIFSRNKLLAEVKTKYAISLDDDLNFLTSNPLEELDVFFKQNPRCAIVGFRIFWSEKLPTTFQSNWTIKKVRNYPGGAHVIKMEAWRDILPYPNWYKIYGEEDFASIQLIKKNWGIFIYPNILTHHRVNLQDRKDSSKKEYLYRKARSLHAAWSNYLIFYPINWALRKILYSIYRQLVQRVFKGDFLSLLGIFKAIGLLFYNTPKRAGLKLKMNKKELKSYFYLKEFSLYWKP